MIEAIKQYGIKPAHYPENSGELAFLTIVYFGIDRIQLGLLTHLKSHQTKSNYRHVTFQVEDNDPTGDYEEDNYAVAF
jgi:hypothetical protein